MVGIVKMVPLEGGAMCLRIDADGLNLRKVARGLQRCLSQLSAQPDTTLKVMICLRGQLTPEQAWALAMCVQAEFAPLFGRVQIATPELMGFVPVSLQSFV
jgi:hypothetical protein